MQEWSYTILLLISIFEGSVLVGASIVLHGESRGLSSVSKVCLSVRMVSGSFSFFCVIRQENLYPW